MTRFDLSTGAEEDLAVYGPPPIKGITEQLWTRERGIFWHDVVARTNHPMSVGAFHRRGGEGQRAEPLVAAHEFGEGKVASGKHWECYAREVKHAQPYIECFGFRFETTEGIIAFSGDTAPAQSVVDLAREADLFVMQTLNREAAVLATPSHVSMTGMISAGRMAQEAGAKRLVATHQSHTLISSDDVSEAIHEIKSVYNGPVFWGTDLMEITW
jgi:ribonuclease BN (tRNA processing enzyme)